MGETFFFAGKKRNENRRVVLVHACFSYTTVEAQLEIITLLYRQSLRELSKSEQNRLAGK